VNNGTAFFNTQFKVEYLNPPSMFTARPTLAKVPKQIFFNQRFSTSVTIPKGLKTNNIQGKPIPLTTFNSLLTHSRTSSVALMDLGFSSHAFHSSARLVFLEHTLSPNGKTLTLTAPPNNRVYPPGPAYLFLTIDDVTSEGVRVMVGDGANPPVRDQGVRI
jgi:hypothetical protein